MFAKKLKKLRTDAGLSREELSKALNLSVSAISNYENDIRKPQTDDIWRRIANYFDVSVDYLMSVDNIGDDDDKSLSSSNDSNDVLHISSLHIPVHPNMVELFNTVKLPIYGEVAAGLGSYADNQIVGYEDIPKEWIRGKEDHILLRVTGDSMYPVFMEDDLLLVKCQPIVDNGNYAVVLIDDENGVVKRVMRGQNWIELQSVNPMYAPRRFEGADVQRIRIFGLVKKSIRNY